MNQTEQATEANKVAALIAERLDVYPGASFINVNLSPKSWRALIAEYQRLAAKEQKQREAGALGKEHGKKGGRPKKGTQSK